MTSKPMPVDSAASNTGSFPPPSRLLGTYPQRQDRLFMQRIPVLAGRIDTSQWRKIAKLAVQYTHSTALHVTTRQDIELHNLSVQHVPSVSSELQKVGLDTYGAGGDSIRNVTVNPACEFDPEGIDVIPLAQRVLDSMQALSRSLDMPRKFKISFSGSFKNHTRPYINDLGFVAQHNGTFQVIGAGSLGPRPKTGIVLCKALPVDEILPFCQAALEMFVQLADRQNRRKARLRHIRQRLGDAEFKIQIQKRFEQVKARHQWPKITLNRGQEGMRHLYTLQLPNGDIDPHLALQLADAAQVNNAVLRINLTHGLELYGPQHFDLPKDLKPLAKLPCVVACPGAATCKNALTHTKELAEQIRKLPNIDFKGKTIAISGCPNHCAHSAVADIGLIGRIKTIDGRRTECFDILLGGGNGRTNKLAEKEITLPTGQIHQWLELYLR